MSISLVGHSAHDLCPQELTFRLLLLISNYRADKPAQKKKKNTPHGFQLHTVADATELLFFFFNCFLHPFVKKNSPHYPGWNLLAETIIDYRLQVVTEEAKLGRFSALRHFPSHANGASRLDTCSCPYHHLQNLQSPAPCKFFFTDDNSVQVSQLNTLVQLLNHPYKVTGSKNS